MLTDYRTYLKTALAERCARNPAYSLRAFARHVGLSPSHLSRVMNGASELSQQAALHIAAELNLKHTDAEQFLDLVNVGTVEGRAKEMLQKRINGRTKKVSRGKLALEQYRLIADWYCMPLYELTKTPSFRSEPQWIAKKLGITLAETKAALDRLTSLGLIRVSEDGKITSCGPDSTETTDDVPTIAIQKHHEEMSKKAIAALKEQKVDEREFQSLHFAFDKKKLAEAKEMIREFVDRFEAQFKTGTGDEIYQMNAQFFNLTKNGDKP